MRVLFKSRTVGDLKQLLQALEATNPHGRVRWYRGHGNGSWPLLPNLARKGYSIAAEDRVVKAFKKNALPFLDRVPRNDWEWLLVMQHHGAATRLLDWTENPLAALYFVVRNLRRKSAGCIWVLDPVGLNGARFVKPEFESVIPCFELDEELDGYLPKSVAAVKVDPQAPQVQPAAALGMRYFERLAAQAGVFTITHRKQIPIDDVDAGRHVGRIEIPQTSKKKLLHQLATLGINELSLFPRLDSVASAGTAEV